MAKLSSDVDSKLTDVLIGQLHRRGISTLIQFVCEDSEKLVTFTGLPHKDVFEIKQNILKKYGGVAKDASEIYKIERNNVVPTNISSLDNLLKGGLYPGQIYEICGLSASGKTQLCFTIAANVALEPHSIVRYIDTKRDFSGSRIEEILLKKNYNKQIIDETLERIKVCCVHSLQQLFNVLRWLTINLKEETEDYRTRIVIIDSLPALIFKFNNDMRKTTALNYLANICRFIAKEFRLAIISVNLITQWNVSGGGGSLSSCNYCTSVVPTLGKYWSHVANTRLLLEKLELSHRKLSIWKSFQLEANLACNLTISDSGIISS